MGIDKLATIGLATMDDLTSSKPDDSDSDDGAAPSQARDVQLSARDVLCATHTVLRAPCTIDAAHITHHTLCQMCHGTYTAQNATCGAPNATYNREAQHATRKLDHTTHRQQWALQHATCGLQHTAYTVRATRDMHSTAMRRRALDSRLPKMWHPAHSIQRRTISAALFRAAGPRSVAARSGCG